MTKKEFINNAVKRMKAEIANGDFEAAHSNADEILCEVLEELGYTLLVKCYKNVGKWYA